ncbi:SprT-like domain-containing protein [Candidatus Woesearchaeota archaeon]|nr:SprT-like domain-containing protein [Candidatus Woesearchaeota archaeon]
MNIAEKAFKELFPDKIEDRRFSVKYSGKFKSYNANVRYNHREIMFSLSNDLKEVSAEIQIGLIQTLLLKIYKEKKNTLNIELYDRFIKNLPKYTTPSKIDPVLKESFDRLNKQYFHDFMETPTLMWGQEALRKLGHYEYANDTIIISTVLKNELELLDYVMYHEMLHKKLKFSSKNGRNYHHTSEFKKLEKQYEDMDAEKKLTKFLTKKRLRRAFRFF